LGEPDTVTVLQHVEARPPTVSVPGATTLWLPAMTRAQSLRPSTRDVTFRVRARLRDGVRMDLNPIRLRYRLRGEDIPALAEHAGSLSPEAWDGAAAVEASRQVTAALAQVPDAMTWARDTQANLSALERDLTRALVRIGYRVDGFDWPPVVAPGGVAESLSALAVLAGESAGLERRSVAAEALGAQRAEAAKSGRTATRQRQVLEQKQAFENQLAAAVAGRDAAALRDLARVERARQDLAAQRILAPAVVAAGVIRAESAALRARGLGENGHRVVRLEGARRSAQLHQVEACPAPMVSTADTERAAPAAPASMPSKSLPPTLTAAPKAADPSVDTATAPDSNSAAETPGAAP
jgi:hypothetical protein